MKLAIISDSHDNLTNLKKALSWIEKEKIDLLLHCGDVASFETLKMILENYSGKVYLVLGNMDKDYSLEKKSNSLENSSRCKIWNEIGEVEIDPVRNSAKTLLLQNAKAKPPYGLELAESKDLFKISNGVDHKKIAFTHSPTLAQKLAREQKPTPHQAAEGGTIVFYGHTHKPWEEKIGKTRLINPGNLAGLLFKATFAIYDTESDKLELMILENFKI